MADKNYKLTFKLSDGTEKSVQFTAPQGEQGEKGDPGEDGYTPVKGTDYFDGEQGVGITDVTIAEV